MSFLDPYLVDTLLPLAGHWETIRHEYDYIKDEAVKWPEPIHNGQWTVIGLRFKSQDLGLQADAPVTTGLCKQIPGVVTFGFSIMQPGCIIEPHRGYTSEVLRIHLGIYVNSHAAIMVGGQTRMWEAGKLLMFDDTQTHSAWNRGSNERVVLLLDVMKSEISSYLR